MSNIPVKAGEGAHAVTAQLVMIGQDVCLCFGGGTGPHIGAVALAMPRPSLADAGTVSATASVLTVTGHKEDLLARAMALEAAARLDRTVCVSVGLHMDAAGPEDIRLLQENCHAAFEQVVGKIQKG